MASPDFQRRVAFQFTFNHRVPSQRALAAVEPPPARLPRLIVQPNYFNNQAQLIITNVNPSPGGWHKSSTDGWAGVAQQFCSRFWGMQPKHGSWVESGRLCLAAGQAGLAFPS